MPGTESTSVPVHFLLQASKFLSIKSLEMIKMVKMIKMIKIVKMVMMVKMIKMVKMINDRENFSDFRSLIFSPRLHMITFNFEHHDVSQFACLIWAKH